MSIVEQSDQIEYLLDGEQSPYREKHVLCMLDALVMAERKILWEAKHFILFHKQIFPYGGTLRNSDLCLSTGSQHVYKSVSKNPMWIWLSDFMKNIKLKKSWLLIAKNHYEFLDIHPFDDGNGRLSRIFTNWNARYVGFAPIKLCAKYRNKYIRLLENQDIEGLADLMEQSETNWK